jgi:glycosyltransferase involved in cell wall biosynthesis
MEAARELGAPGIVSIQGGDGHWVGSCCGTHERAMRAVLDHAGALLIGSASFRDEVVGRFGTSPTRFTIVPGAVDAERFALRASPATDRPTLLYHGRVDRRKGALDLLDAVARMDTGVRVVMSGIGPDLDAARAKAEELLLDAGFPGAVPYDQVPGVYAGGDIFVSPTYAEGFSNTILEAMASGMPVVAGNAVGVVDCIEDGVNGVLVEPGDVDGLARALDDLLADAPRREELARRARDDVEREYAWPVVARQIMDAYARAPVRTEWTSPAGPREPCRFREAPHLL